MAMCRKLGSETKKNDRGKKKTRNAAWYIGYSYLLEHVAVKVETNRLGEGYDRSFNVKSPLRST